ncbi:hypothetical protein Tco_0967615 [Tanacetum coccineum]
MKTLVFSDTKLTKDEECESVDSTKYQSMIETTALAISTTEAEYVSARKACQQALWMKQALIDYDVRLDDILIILFKHVVSVFPELAIDHYLSHDRLSSTTLNHPSSSRPLDATIDENDEESFHSNSSSPPQNVSSSSNVVSRVRQNPTHESQYLNTHLSETINLQTQQRDAHREGLRSIVLALKDMMSEKRK